MEDWEKRLEEGGILIQQFYHWLQERKIALMNDLPIEAFNDFISVYTDRRLEEVTPADIKLFLYDFYIRKCDPQVDPLTPLSFFLQFLEDKGMVKDSLPFQSILENQAKYRKRVESYPSLELSESRWYEQNYEWGLRMNDEMAQEIIRDEDVESLPTLRNFAHILEYVKDNEIRLTPARGFFRLRDILLIDEGFIHTIRPFTGGVLERPSQIHTEDDYLYFYYLDTMARVARYLQKRKGRLHLTAKGRHFLNLPPSARYLRLFCIHWYEINWSFFYDDRVLEELQRLQPDLECIFRDFAGMEEVPVKSFFDGVFSELDIKPTHESGNYFFLFARYALQSAVMDWLEELGIIIGRHKKSLDNLLGSKMITFRFTPLGRRIIDYFFTSRSQ